MDRIARRLKPLPALLALLLAALLSTPASAGPEASRIGHAPAHALVQPEAVLELSELVSGDASAQADPAGGADSPDSGETILPSGIPAADLEAAGGLQAVPDGIGASRFVASYQARAPPAA